MDMASRRIAQACSLSIALNDVAIPLPPAVRRLRRALVEKMSTIHAPELSPDMRTLVLSSRRRGALYLIPSSWRSDITAFLRDRSAGDRPFDPSWACLVSKLNHVDLRAQASAYAWSARLAGPPFDRSKRLSHATWPLGDWFCSYCKTHEFASECARRRRGASNPQEEPLRRV